MDLHCTNCGRHYDVGDETARRVPAARCVCGARLNIASSSGFKRLGNYILERRLAVGGMGEIFYGKIAGVEGFEREVAIKKMLPHLSADRSFIDMMVKEAKLTVLLNHPNIVQVFDLAREGDEYYIAMEYVPGTNVGQLLELCFKRRVFLPVEVCLFITMKVLRGLAYAHQLRGPDGAPMNILHRDITPQNIMVTPQAWVKITDFGIAKARNEISTTTPGMIKGKLGYIAPEQMTDAEVTQSVDIFCAGILLWESLASKRLFKGSDEIDTFRLIQACRIPSLADIREDVSEELERVIAGALTPTPEERYASCEAYYEALNEVIFPRTIDDLESATTRYFDEHPELFDGVVSASGLSDGATMQVDVPGTITGDLPLITDVLAVPKTLQPERDTPSNSRLWVAVLALLLVIAGGAAFWITQKPAPETPLSPPLSQEEVQLAVTAKHNAFVDCYRDKRKAFENVDGVSAKLTIASTGGVAAVEVAPASLGDAAQCLETTLRAIQLRSHTAPRFDASVSLPNPTEVLEPVAAKPTVKPAPKAPAGNKVSPPRPLTPQDIRKGVQSRQRGIARCLRQYSNVAGASVPDQLETVMRVASSGRVTDATFQPKPPATVGNCLKKQFTRIRYHRQPKDGLKVKFPLTIKLYSNDQ